MADRFDVCHPITAKWEGGWSNHKADPGGATMYGVTQAVYDKWRKKRGLKTQSVRNITMQEALIIYKENYWNACGAPDLFPGVDLSVYDASVNSGVSAAAEKAATRDKTTAKATGTTAAASATAPTVDTSNVTDGSLPIDVTTMDTTSLWIFGTVAVAALVVTVFLIIRSRAAKEREAAYKELVAA